MNEIPLTLPMRCSSGEIDIPHVKPGVDWVLLEASLVAVVSTNALPGRCFDNAWRTYLALSEWFEPDGAFVEGWWVVVMGREIVVNEHGWCQTGKGKIIDPTLVAHGLAPDQVHYIAGVERPGHELRRLVDEEQCFPYVRFDGQHGPDGMGHPQYRAASEVARKLALRLASQTNPAREVISMVAQDGEADPRASGGRGETGLLVMVVKVPEEGKERHGRPYVRTQ